MNDEGRTIFINKSQIVRLNELKAQVTFFEFKNKLISFLKELLSDPLNATIDNFFRDNGISRSLLIKMLLKKNIIEREEKVEEIDGKSVYRLKYKVPKANFKTKIKRLYTYFFERIVDTSGIDDMVKNGMTQVTDGVITETDCAGVGAVGDGSDSSGQFVQPFFGKPISKGRIYKPKKEDE